MAFGRHALGRENKSARVEAAASHYLGGALGGATIGATVAGVGNLVAVESHRLTFIIVGVAAVALFTLATRGRPFGLHCQVPRTSPLSTNPHYLWWGGLLGVGFATKIPHSSLLVLMLLIAAAGVPAGAALGGLYGATRASVAIGLAWSSAGGEPSSTGEALRAIGPYTRGLNLITGTWGGILVPMLAVLTPR